MNTNRRKHPRFSPNGLSANIALISNSFDKETIVEGIIIDMSSTGIKIKLKSAIPSGLPLDKIKITLKMPQSGIFVSIHGIIRHIQNNTEFGLQFSEDHLEKEINDLIFECVKLAK